MALVEWAVPRAADPRPAVLSTVLVPVGCGLAWALGHRRQGLDTVVWACLGLYLLSSFAAARLVTFFPNWNYWRTLVPLQTAGGLALALIAGLEGTKPNGGHVQAPQDDRCHGER